MVHPRGGRLYLGEGERRSECSRFGSPQLLEYWTDVFSPALHSLLLTILNKGDKPTLLVTPMPSHSEMLVKGETDSEVLSYAMINEPHLYC